MKLKVKRFADDIVIINGVAYHVSRDNGDVRVYVSDLEVNGRQDVYYFEDWHREAKKGVCRPVCYRVSRDEEVYDIWYSGPDTDPDMVVAAIDENVRNNQESLEKTLYKQFQWATDDKPGKFCIHTGCQEMRVRLYPNEADVLNKRFGGVVYREYGRLLFVLSFMEQLQVGMVYDVAQYYEG